MKKPQLPKLEKSKKGIKLKQPNVNYGKPKIGGISIGRKSRKSY